MIDKIVILRYAPYSQNISLFFSVDYLIKSGITIDYWDVSLITTRETGVDIGGEQININIIHSYNELVDYIRAQDKSTTLFIPFMSYFHKTFKCFYLLSKYQCKLGYCVTGFLPTTCSSSKRKVIQILKSHNFKKMYYAFLNLVCNFIKKKSTIIRPSDIIYYTGYKAPLNEYKFNEATHFIQLNSIDYERFLSSDKRDMESLVKGDYMVFVDQYLPFHPDAKINGLSAIDSEGYYKKMNDFFFNIELYYGMKVVIAAHPKAIKYKTYDYFNHREVYWGITDELVKHANLVIMHFSTSVSFSVLHKKKVIFLSMPEIKNMNLTYHNLIVAFAESLGTVYYYLDEQLNVDGNISLNCDKYEDYKYSYLTTVQTEHRINGISLIDSFSLFK